MHVTLRSAFRPLRSQFVFPTLRGAISGTERRRKGRFRVTHFSAQFEHLHLIVEADSRAALLAGIRGLSISIARAINQIVNRKGRLWSDRWHGHTLTTPRATRHAIAYVVGNFRKHTRERWMLDPYSSSRVITYPALDEALNSTIYKAVASWATWWLTLFHRSAVAHGR